ncbi:ATP-binding cassette sub-family A member 9-like isoform X2 [Rhinatrema bivittatum]|uniref:ATP-binding cassette sub-family A member 9-like isoform X2 n=1 Tax=Rhinatrema bivittatum TaxID=194408 RepID=UPI001126996B|nr:ATP-binding cassette sub-family A member 9-like isoform X2 [Rhinatrema bivittatum]
MLRELQREPSVCQQTAALLWKNLLIKWRMKKQTLQECLFSLLCIPLFFLLSIPVTWEHSESSPVILGRLDDFNATDFVVGYTPVTPTTRQIMGKVKEESFLHGIRTEEFEDEKAMYQAWLSNHSLIGVVFKDSFSYVIRYNIYDITVPNDHITMAGYCINVSEYCSGTKYWLKGFTSLQASIDAVIIQVTTNHSVWEEMKSIVVEHMKSASFREMQKVFLMIVLIIIITPFSPLMYFMSIYLTREKRNFKEVMKMMGLHDFAFWLSWGLLYTVFIFIISNVLTILIYTGLFTESSYFVILLLFFFYGISSMCFSFMLSSLLRKPRLTAITGFFLTLLLGAISLILVILHVPRSLQWILSLFCPFAFVTGITQVFHLEMNMKGALFSELMEDAYPVFMTYIILVLDAVLYMLLAVYFDKVLPNKYGVRLPFLFFLKSSYWRSNRRYSDDIITKKEGTDHPVFGDCVEPVPSEFHGKEAIRINNIKKTYTEDKKVEALRGLLFDVYEGQITAILGHSGAGKTTLLNILSGLSAPTDGSVEMYGYRLSRMENVAEIRKIIGVCPQFDIKFDALTVKENLRVFAKIKGIPPKEVENEVKNILTMLEINNIQDSQASSLSGGQKRKLTFAIAVLGDPQILLLDEPSSGLDPCSRYYLWTVLKERKAGRVILLSTQFMDEADILADRKAVISNGRLKCIGTSLYLKRKWGIGYHLSMQVSTACDTDRMTSLVQQYIPDAKLSGQNKEELIYTLPFENVDAFPDLFCALDSLGQEIIHYGVSMGTLDHVFLKLEGEAEIDQEDYGVFRPEQADEERDDCALSEMEQSLLSLSEIGKVTIRGTALWRQQVCAIARVRFLNLKHESKTFRSIALLLVIFIIPMVLNTSILNTMHLMFNWELTPSLYFLRPGENPYKHYTSLLVHNDTGRNIGNLMHSLKSQGIRTDVINGKNFTNDYLYNGALKISLEDKRYRFTIASNIRTINGIPVLVNVISNGLLEILNSTRRIRIWNNPFQRDEYQDFWLYLLLIYILFMAFSSGLPPHFAMSSIQDYKIKSRSLLRLSGLFSSAYWFGQALVDVPLYWLLLYSMIGIIFAFCYHVTLPPAAALLLVVFILIYGLVVVLLMYVISFIFRKGQRNPDCWSFVLVMITIILHIIIHIFDPFSQYPQHVVSAFIPVYALLGFLNFAALSTVHCIIFIFLLRCLEMKYGKKMMTKDPIFRILRRKDKVLQNPEDPVGEDEDVQAERECVRNTIAAETNEEKPIILASSLRKEYKDMKASSIFKKKKKAATKNISFCVKKGEVFGLLGPNGAGKSTSVYMLTGDTMPTAGQVLIRENDTNDGSSGFLGYCAQSNTLWPNITVKEHLEIYAAVRGLKKEDADVAIKRIVNALELKEHLQKAAKKLSTGITRKVCFALSMLGNPTVVFLDEPSTGLDPKGQQQVWRAIRAAFKNKERGAILTTHYMEEAEAVCDRVAIMVSGKFRAIGSIQHLKKKFGKGYLLEMKIKESQPMDPIHQEILQIFPGAARQERFPSLLVYKIPMENVSSLAPAFRMLQEAKRRFHIEEYSFSQSTLQQVFLELTKEQEREDFDMALDTTFDWKQLQQEDT